MLIRELLFTRERERERERERDICGHFSFRLIFYFCILLSGAFLTHKCKSLFLSLIISLQLNLWLNIPTYQLTNVNSDFVFGQFYQTVNVSNQVNWSLVQMMRMIEKAETTAILYINFTTRKRTINARKMSASLRREREKIYKNANGENVYRYLRIQERERGLCAIGDRSLLHRERERDCIF